MKNRNFTRLGRWQAKLNNEKHFKLRCCIVFVLFLSYEKCCIFVRSVCFPSPENSHECTMLLQHTHTPRFVFRECVCPHVKEYINHKFYYHFRQKCSAPLILIMCFDWGEHPQHDIWHHRQLCFPTIRKVSFVV